MTKKRQTRAQSVPKGSIGSMKPSFEPLRLTNHRDFARAQDEIFRRFNASPEFVNLLLINPVLAMKEVGVELSPSLRKHVLHTLEHPPELRSRQTELETKLKQELGEKARPNDPQWVSEFLFEKLQLKPLNTSGQTPTYKPALPPETIERLQKLRPRVRFSQSDRRARGFITLGESRSAVRRLDLDAPLPKLKSSSRMPKRVELETLYFYRDSHPLVRDVLELGILQRRAFPIQSADSYRKIREGKRPHVFRSWIRSVRFPETLEGNRDDSDG